MQSKHNNDNWKAGLGRVLLFCLACALILMVGSYLTKGLAKPWADFVLAASASIAVFLLTILFVRWENLRLSAVGVVPGRHTLLRVTLGLLIGTTLVLLHAALVLSCGHLQLTRVPSISAASIFFPLLLYFILALREELAFRGYPLRSLANGLGAWKAQIIIAVIFALEHLAGGYSWVQAFFGAGVGALLFGLAALKTQGIALPVGLHAAWNFGQWGLGFKNEPGIWQAIVEPGYEATHEQTVFLFYLLVMGIGIGSFYFYRPNPPSTSR